MNNWKNTIIGNAFSFTSKPRDLSVADNEEIPFIRMEDIPLSNIYADKFTLKMKNKISSATYFENGDFLLAKITPSFENGKQGIAKINNKFGYATTEVIPIKALEGQSDIYFLFFYLKDKRVRNELAGKMEGSTGRQRLNKDLIKNMVISLPPLEEQRKIVFILSLIQKAIEEQEKIIETTTELKKSLMQKLFTEGLHGEKQKKTEIGLIPESWEVSELKNVVSSIDYGLSEAIPKNPPKNGVKIVSTADITKSGEILYEQIRTISAKKTVIERLLLKTGDVLFNWRNSLDHIGKSSIFTAQNEKHIFASFILRIRCDEQKSHNRYLCYLMNYFREIGVFSRLARRAVNQANYNRNEIYVLKIPVPSYSEQVEISDVIQKIDENIVSHTNLKIGYEIIFNNLLHQLMSGELRVDDINLN